jgi:restriction endonuclease S subunit
MPQKFEAPSEKENQVYTLRMAEIQRFEAAIEKIRNILRSVAITGMDSMRHCCLYVLSRAITRETAGKLKIPEKFAWENIMHTLHTVDGGDQKVIDLFGNPNQESLVAHFDRLFKTQNFSFDVKSLPKHKEILEILNPLNLKALDSSMDILGWVYEDHLRKGSTSSRDLGQFFTDRKICDYMVALCKPTFKIPRVPESICDPTMGTAGFLSMFIKYFKKAYPDTPVDWNVQQKEVHGCDSDSKVAGLARLNLFLESGGVFQNLVTKDSLGTDLPAMGYDIICANMPFGLKGLKYADSCERVKKLGINTTKSEPLFMQLMMVSLNMGGRCAVVVPDGMLVNNSKGHNATRKYLLDNFELKRVIKMRGSFFTNTGIQPSIMYFVNTGMPTSEVEFWDVEDKGNGTVIEKMVLSVPRSKFDDACSLDMRRYQEVAVVANTGGYPMVKLGDVVTLKQGFPFKSADYVSVGEGLYVLKHNNLQDGVVEVSKNQDCISSSQNTTNYLLKKGDVVVSMDFDCGKVGKIVNDGWVLNQRMSLLRTNSEHLSQDYLYWILFAGKFHESMTNVNTGTTIKHISGKNIAEAMIPLPPLHIQQEIVTALDLIYNNAATAKAATASVKSQMAAVVRSVGACGFERKKLGDIVDIEGGEYITKSSETIGEYPVYGGGSASYYINRFNREPTCVINKDGMSASCVQMVNKKFFMNHHGWTLKLKSSEFIEKFLHWQLYFRANEIYNLATGSCQKGLNYHTFIEFTIFCPPLPIQHEVLAMLNEMEAELQTLEQMAAKAEQRAKFILDGYLTPAPPPVEAEPVVDPNSIAAFIEKHITHKDGAEVPFKKVAQKYKEWATARPEHKLLPLSELKAALSPVLGDLENDKYKGITLN